MVDVVDRGQRFSESGIVPVYYDSTSERWKKYIRTVLSKLKEQMAFGYIVVCALENSAERDLSYGDVRYSTRLV